MTNTYLFKKNLTLEPSRGSAYYLWEIWRDFTYVRANFNTCFWNNVLSGKFLAAHSCRQRWYFRIRN